MCGFMKKVPGAIPSANGLPGGSPTDFRPKNMVEGLNPKSIIGANIEAPKKLLS